MTRADRQRVVVVTGGGGGIGAAIAEELGRRGNHVVTVDPLVTLDGAEQLPPPEETTAGRIVAAGGSARASSLSVTDRDGLQALFEELVAEHGGVNGVVNVAGITRPTGFATGSEADWRGVLEVHLDGYLNVLAAALPHMTVAGHGRVVGVTSGSGWRAANAGAYSCAKRAVASLTWQLGAQPPAGVVVNAMSPIAVTRMVTAALGRAPTASAGRKGSATGGLSLGSMPEPEELGPIGAHLTGADLGWLSGHVLFTGGSELAVVDPPGLLEVVRTSGAGSVAHLLDDVVPGALAPAEAKQASTGGGNPRFGPSLGAASGDVVTATGQSCAVVSDRPELGAAVGAALEARGVAVRRVEPLIGSFEATAAALPDDVDAVVVAMAAGAPSSSSGWERILAEHAGLVDHLHMDAAWARAAADSGRSIRLVTLTDATTAGGRSRAQAAAQLARASMGATDERVAAFSVAIESAAADDLQVAGGLAAHLVAHPGAAALSGAELAVGAGWLGLRSHPRPRASISYGGPDLPPWIDRSLREIVGAPAEAR